MALQFHPKAGTVLVCDFSTGFQPPEMVKRRPAIVISPQIQGRHGLCTIVPISTEPPRIKQQLHLELPDLALPPPYDKGPNWVKADMVFAARWERLELFRQGKDASGKRIYDIPCLSDTDLAAVRKALLCSIGLSYLTKHFRPVS